jgi:hypothetical protein
VNSCAICSTPAGPCKINFKTISIPGSQWKKSFPRYLLRNDIRLPISSTQLDATASVPGTFVNSLAAGTVLAAGTQTLSVTFTPHDTTDYATATARQ